MKIKLQTLNDIETNQYIPIKSNSSFPEDYYADFLGNMDETSLRFISKKMQINMLYFYMRFHYFIEENVTEYCQDQNLSIHWLGEGDSYKFAKIDVDSIQKFKKCFFLINIITERMGDITLFSVGDNLEIPSGEALITDGRFFITENSERECVTVLISEDVYGTFRLMSNDPMYTPKSLQEKLDELIFFV